MKLLNNLSVCFNGCSFTVGEGFGVEDRKKYNYDSLLTARFNFDKTNQAVCGNSNHKIFLSSSLALISGKYDIVFVQWSALNRIWLSPGPESYFFINDKKFTDFRYRDLYVSKFEKDNLRNLLLLLTHDYQSIFDLIDYCNILAEIASYTKSQVVFINGLVPWQSDLITPVTDNLDASLSEYTKSILDFSNRDDSEIKEFFYRLQNKFSTVDQSLWVNLFNSFQNNVIDVGPEGHHPGIKSNIWMANLIGKYLLDQ
jgi:hypothetical protein